MGRIGWTTRGTTTREAARGAGAAARAGGEAGGEVVGRRVPRPGSRDARRARAGRVCRRLLRRSFRRFCVHGAPVPELCESLSTPFFPPPSWLFGPAWKALYLVMAPAGWLVRRAGSKPTIA